MKATRDGHLALGLGIIDGAKADVPAEGLVPAAEEDESRRRSLYLPLDSTPQANTFAFPSSNGSGSPQPPKSPSEIHPLYREPHDLPKGSSDPRFAPPKRSFYTQSKPLIPPAVLKRLDSSACWLVYYFLLNLGLTLHNKFVLVKFPFPWSLTAMHCLVATIGSTALKQQGLFTPASLSTRENAIMAAFSLLFTINIAVSNLSLNLVSVALHQVIRASTPLFTILISAVFLGKKTSGKTMLSLVPVIAGVGLATLGDYSCTLFGFLLTVLGTLLAALKTVATNVLQTSPRLKLHPLDLLNRMSGMAFCQCVIYAHFSGELAKVREFGATEMDREKMLGLIANGMIAFLLNVVSFSANKKTSALTMTVAANLKQVLTILLGVYLFNIHVTATNLVGVTLTVIGSALYGKIGLDAKRAKPPSTPLLVFQEPKAGGI